MAVSTYVANEILDAIFNNGSFALGGDPYISLHTGDPGATGANEVSGGSYARVQVAFNAAAAKSAKNTSSAAFTVASSTVITYVGVWDAVSTGNFIIGGALSESITSTGTVTLAAEKIIGAVT